MNNYLFTTENLDSFQERINNNDFILLFLDYDGTLAPFNSDPAKAIPFQGIENIINRLTSNNRFYLSLVSGRPIIELTAFINNPMLNYAGKHGLEIKMNTGDDFYWDKDKKIPLDCLYKVKKYFEDNLGNRDGFILEDKGVVITIHHPANQDIKYLLAELTRIVSQHDYFELMTGRHIIEIRPAHWNKNDAVTMLIKAISTQENLTNYLSVYIGDDTTDEDVFQALEDGITIYVQNEDNLQTAADYYLKNPADVLELLKVLNTLS